MKRSTSKRKAKPVARTPVPVKAAELIPPAYREYTPQPVPVESAKPWYRFGH